MSEWWWPVTFTREQVEFLLPHLETLKSGEWPDDPSPSSAVDLPGVTSLSCHAPYEACCLVAAELKERLGHLDEDRAKVEDYYINGMTEYQLTRKFNMDIEDLRHRIRLAVGYISSGRIGRWIDTPKRKGLTYKEYVRSHGSHYRHRLRA